MFSKISSVINWIYPGQQQFSYIMFVSKVRTYPCDAPFRRSTLSKSSGLTHNIRPDLKNLPGTSISA